LTVGLYFLSNMENFRVVCVNDRNKPDGFVGDWIKKGEIYTVVDAKKLARQRLSIGYKFAELSIHEKSVFQYFLANRFRPYDEDDSKAEEAVQELLEESLVDLVM